MCIIFKLKDIPEASRVQLKTRQVLSSIPTRGNDILILSFNRSGNEAKRGVDFRHSTHNAS